MADNVSPMQDSTSRCFGLAAMCQAYFWRISGYAIDGCQAKSRSPPKSGVESGTQVLYIRAPDESYT